MKPFLVLAALFFCTLPSGLAQLSDPGLYVETGQTIKVAVDLSISAVELGLQEKSIQSRSEWRLRQALIPVERDTAKQAANTLYLNVNVKGDSVIITLAFAKLAVTQVGDVKYLRRMTTWTDRVGGVHNGSPFFVMEGLGGVLDRFVYEYLQANRR